MNDNIKRHLISASMTFLSSFLSIAGIMISQIPVEQVMSGEFFKTGGLIALILTAAGTAVKALFDPVVPQRLGGLKK